MAEPLSPALVILIDCIIGHGFPRPFRTGMGVRAMTVLDIALGLVDPAARSAWPCKPSVRLEGMDTLKRYISIAHIVTVWEL